MGRDCLSRIAEQKFLAKHYIFFLLYSSYQAPCQVNYEGLQAAHITTKYCIVLYHFLFWTLAPALQIQLKASVVFSSRIASRELTSEMIEFCDRLRPPGVFLNIAMFFSAC